MSKILGLADVVVNGVTLLSDAQATIDPGGVNRTTRKGNKVVGFSEEPMEATLEVGVFIDATFSVDFYRNLTGATVNFVADTGQTWSMQNAWCSKPPPIGQKEGTAKVTFVSPPAEEIL